MNFRAILFDLDGTLLDTLADLADAMNNALIEMGFPAHPPQAYCYFVGDGVRNESERALPQESRDPETIDRLTELARDNYTKCWYNKTRPYPHILQLLGELEKKGIPKVILSNKPHDFTKLLVDKYFSDFKFQIVRGKMDSFERKPDPASALDIAEKMNISPESFLYLGDTNTDMQTALNAGMYPVGALWGFRSEDELKNAGAKVLLKDPLGILDLLEG